MTQQQQPKVIQPKAAPKASPKASSGPKVVEAKASSPTAHLGPNGQPEQCYCTTKGSRCHNPARWPLVWQGHTYYTCTTHHKATTVSLIPWVSSSPTKVASRQGAGKVQAAKAAAPKAESATGI